jgi:hypothetical protein
LPRINWPGHEQHCYANRMYKRIFTATLACLLAGAALAQAYRWVDEDGVVHYSDRPQAGAEEFELPKYRAPSGSRTPARSSAFSRRSETQPEEEPEEEPGAYQAINIASPGPEETLWNIEGVLNVALELQPGLKPGHQVRVYFDGEERLMSRNTTFQVPEVYRGVHNIQVEVVDASGNLMIRSQPNRFYVQQNSIAMLR